MLRMHDETDLGGSSASGRGEDRGVRRQSRGNLGGQTGACPTGPSAGKHLESQQAHMRAVTKAAVGTSDQLTGTSCAEHR